MIRAVKLGGALGGFFWPHFFVSGTFTLATRLWMNNVASSVTSESMKLMKVPPKLHTRQYEELFYNFTKFYMYGSIVSNSLLVATIGVAAAATVLIDLR